MRLHIPDIRITVNPKIFPVLAYPAGLFPTESRVIPDCRDTYQSAQRFGGVTSPVIQSFKNIHKLYKLTQIKNRIQGQASNINRVSDPETSHTQTQSRVIPAYRGPRQIGNDPVGWFEPGSSLFEHPREIKTKRTPFHQTNIPPFHQFYNSPPIYIGATTPSCKAG